MKKVLILFIVLSSQLSFAQNVIVKGNIIDSWNSPFAGSQVININSKEKVIADFDGNYSIKAKLGDTLLFKPPKDIENCYTTSERIVFNDSNIDVKLWFLETIRYKFCKTKPRELLVFIGKLKFVKDIHEDVENIFDPSLCIEVMNTYGVGQYLIIKEVHGDFLHEKSNILFDISEHGSQHSIISTKPKYALLIVEKYCDDKYYLIHHHALYRSIDNKWVIEYPNLYPHTKQIDSLVLGNIRYNRRKGIIKTNRKDLDSLRKYLKPPYFLNRGKSFYPAKDYYPEDYFNIWKSNQKEWIYDN
ncbi:hypothetical protein C1T31_11515 [Hanstruepera neustonica]|uniref:Carboxypeptidase-like regulatory domain-containing protein n=1 Tax=Hanstruepera neustonica TaxID=1445657 RepID=A0A2K1DWK3_9FLAO|nr:hypothetical protein [Hanstruepera neustonica]PNQ72415.1 hypothetical protein C1T31_11515 [Hanstruepera neustonica]